MVGQPIKLVRLLTAVLCCATSLLGACSQEFSAPIVTIDGSARPQTFLKSSADFAALPSDDEPAQDNPKHGVTRSAQHPSPQASHPTYHPLTSGKKSSAQLKPHTQKPVIPKNTDQAIFEPLDLKAHEDIAPAPKKIIPVVKTVSTSEKKMIALPPQITPAVTSPVEEKKADIQTTPNKQESPFAQATPITDPDLSWEWPVHGPLQYKTIENGLEISGQLDQQIYAASTGEVVYLGPGVFEDGQTLMIKKNDLYIDAYGNIERSLVSQGQKVLAGQAIAVMGHAQNGSVFLHFEIRKQGDPVPPLSVLPKETT